MGGFPAGPFASGLTRGAGIGQMLLRTMLERQEFDRRKAADERRAQVEDIQTQMLLNQSGRPITAGMVEDSAEMQIPGYGEANVGGSTARAAIRRKADPSRRVQYKTRGGETIERELYTPEQQASRHLESERAQRKMLSDIHVDQTEREEVARAGARRKQSALDLEEQGLPLGEEMAKMLGVPAGRKILPSQFDDLLRAQATLEQLRGGGPDPLMHVQNLTDDTGQVTQVTTSKRGKVAQTRLGRLGKSKSTEATPGQEATEGRFRQRRIDAAQKDHDEADAAEQKLHAEAKAIGERLKAITTGLEAAVEDKDPVGVKELQKERRKLEGRLPQVRQQARTLNARKVEALKRKETLRGGSPVSQSGGGRIRVQLADGRVGTIEEADFDAKTMKRL